MKDVAASSKAETYQAEAEQGLNQQKQKCEGAIVPQNFDVDSQVRKFQQKHIWKPLAGLVIHHASLLPLHETSL